MMVNKDHTINRLGYSSTVLAQFVRPNLHAPALRVFSDHSTQLQLKSKRRRNRQLHSLHEIVPTLSKQNSDPTPIMCKPKHDMQQYKCSGALHRILHHVCRKSVQVHNSTTV
ncbi:unnamed protein product, partial [Sphacelaria rigidula]